MHRSVCLTVLLAGSLAASTSPPEVRLRPAVTTQPVAEDADDPAIWIHPGDPARSLVLGTDKTAAPTGALYAFGLDGRVRQKIAGIDRPNNVDVEYGLKLRGQAADVAVVTERYRSRLRAFAIDRRTGALRDVSGDLRVFAGEKGERAAPMGVGLYRRKDGAVFALVSRKEGPRSGLLWQYRLQDDGRGRVRAVKVRELGTTAGGEVEAVVVDDALGYVYYAEEDAGIHKWAADPAHPAAGRELVLFGRDGFEGDREGLAVYARRDGTGYLIATDQRSGDSAYRVYRREGEPGRPHDHSRVVRVLRGGADETDGLEVTAVPLGSQFPAGLMAAMNSSGRNFFLFRWAPPGSAAAPRAGAGR